MLYSFEGNMPRVIGDNVFISEQACIIGSVVIENNVCILPGAVIRADNDIIYICEGTNIQDGAVIHTDPGLKMRIGENVTIAHKAMLHGCNIDDWSVIGINAVILNNANIGKHCIIGANSLVLENDKIPDRSLLIGSPAKIKKQFTDIEVDKMKWFSSHYIEKIHRFNNGLVKIKG